MINSAHTFNVLKYGYFTAEDIKQRWVTGDNSKFADLPIKVKLAWIDLLVMRYRPHMFKCEETNFDTAVGYFRKVIAGEKVDNITPSLSLFSYSIYSFAAAINIGYLDLYFGTDVMHHLEKDATSLNCIISEYY